MIDRVDVARLLPTPATDAEIIIRAIDAASTECAWRRKLGVGNAARFAELLDVSRSRISQIRNGRKKLTKLQRLVCQTIIGSPATARAILGRTGRTNA